MALKWFSSFCNVLLLHTKSCPHIHIAYHNKWFIRKWYWILFYISHNPVGWFGAYFFLLCCLFLVLRSVAPFIFFLIWQFVTSYNWVHSKSLRLSLLCARAFLFLYSISIMMVVGVAGPVVLMRLNLFVWFDSLFGFVPIAHCTLLTRAISSVRFNLTCSNLRHNRFFFILLLLSISCL